jgi:DNA replication protein DnaC
MTFAMREYTLTQAEDLYELVKGRYRRGSLILTSNREPKDLDELFPTPVLVEGLLDRLLNSTYVITMLGRSYRPQQRPGSSPNAASTHVGRPAGGKLP